MSYPILTQWIIWLKKQSVKRIEKRARICVDHFSGLFLTKNNVLLHMKKWIDGIYCVERSIKINIEIWNVIPNDEWTKYINNTQNMVFTKQKTEDIIQTFSYRMKHMDFKSTKTKTKTQYSYIGSEIKNNTTTTTTTNNKNNNTQFVVYINWWINQYILIPFLSVPCIYAYME